MEDGPTGVLGGKKVLTVDDDYRNVFAVAAVLEQEGIEVHSAESGREALKQLQEVAIDLVLMDIMMPEMDGMKPCGGSAAFPFSLSRLWPYSQGHER